MIRLALAFLSGAAAMLLAVIAFEAWEEWDMWEDAL